MTALPRVKDPEKWRTRRDKAIRDRRNASHEQRMLELAVANQLKSELRAEKSMTHDDRLAAGKDHEVAMAVRTMMTAVSDLCEMANDGIGYDLILADIDDLELSHARLGQLLDSLHSIKRAAQ